jgi:hypothetical protein
MLQIFAVAIALVALIVPFADAQDGHLECFKIKDALNLKGIVDLESPQLGVDAGCRIQKAKYYCVPATKSVVAVQDGRDPITPLPLSAVPAPGDPYLLLGDLSERISS